MYFTLKKILLKFQEKIIKKEIKIYKYLTALFVACFAFNASAATSEILQKSQNFWNNTPIKHPIIEVIDTWHYGESTGEEDAEIVVVCVGNKGDIFTLTKEE